MGGERARGGAEDDSRTLPDDWATAAVPFGSGLAVGTYSSGLALVGPEGASAPGPGLWVNAGALATSGGLLAAGVLDGGLWLHDGATTRTLGTPDGLPDADVTDVVDDGAGGLWVATRGGLAQLGPAPHAEEWSRQPHGGPDRVAAHVVDVLTSAPAARRPRDTGPARPRHGRPRPPGRGAVRRSPPPSAARRRRPSRLTLATRRYQ